MTNPVFTGDVYTAAGLLLGPGPLYNIMSVSVEETLDAAGRVTLLFPASDPRVTDLVANERRVKVRTVDGIIAEGIMQEISHDLQPRTVAVAGPDRLGELFYLSTQYNRTYANVATATIIGTTGSGTGLLRETGWTPGTVTPSVTPTTIAYDSQTVLNALIALAKQGGDHFREGSTARTLDWGVFGENSGLRLVNPGQVRRAQSTANTFLVYLNQLQVSSISADIANRLYPLGSSKFDLRDASSAATTIKVRANRGPLGVTTALVGAHAATATLNVTAGTGTSFTAGETVWLGTATDWTQTHETGVVQSTGANTVVLTAPIAGSYAGGEALIQRPCFYVEDTASQAIYGVREDVPQFNWIKPTDDTDATARQQAADVLYYAALAHLTRFSTAYQAYAVPEVFNLPATLRVGQKVRMVVRLLDNAGVLVLDIDDLFYVTKITRTWDGSGRLTAALEIANVARPAPNNLDFVLYNLDTNQWVGVK